MPASFSTFLAQAVENPALAMSALLTLGVLLVNGWTDAPNAIAGAVVTGALSFRRAVLLAAVCNFLGVLCVTSAYPSVAETVYSIASFGGGPEAASLALCAAMGAVVLWAAAAWRWGIPTSESHALVAALQSHSAPVQKITIIPRTSGALGYTLQVDDGDHFLMSKDELLNKIATYTGGRAAEELVFHSASTGASNDIEQATKLARSMISRFGMSDEFGFVAFETVSNQYLGGDASLACSPETQALMDKKVTQLVEEQHQKALNILKENEGKLHELAGYLYQHETITGQEFMDILERKALPEQK